MRFGHPGLRVRAARPVRIVRPGWRTNRFWSRFLPLAAIVMMVPGASFLISRNIVEGAGMYANRRNAARASGSRVGSISPEAWSALISDPKT